MEIKKNRYGHERVFEKIAVDKIRVMGDSIISRESENEDGQITMFDFEGGPCFNLGGKVEYKKWNWTIKKIIPEPPKKDGFASVVLVVKM
jgi:hypothetical protein